MASIQLENDTRQGISDIEHYCWEMHSQVETTSQGLEAHAQSGLGKTIFGPRPVKGCSEHLQLFVICMVSASSLEKKKSPCSTTNLYWVSEGMQTRLGSRS